LLVCPARRAQGAHLDAVGKHKDTRGVAHGGGLLLDSLQVLGQLGRLLVLSTHLHDLQGEKTGVRVNLYACT